MQGGLSPRNEPRGMLAAGRRNKTIDWTRAIARSAGASRGVSQMKLNRQIASAVAGILGTHMGLAVAAEAPAAPDTASAAGLQEVVVTAQRRSENAQNVPIAITAFSAEQLQQLNVTNFDDL